MATFRLRFHVGPHKDHQRQLARKLKRSKIRVVSLGTEHISIDAKGTSCSDAYYNALTSLERKGFKTSKPFGRGFASCQKRSR